MKKQYAITIFVLGLLFISCKEETNNFENYETREYNLLFGANLAGYQISKREADGTFYFEYEFNDRGRGPHIEERVKINEKGAIVYQDIQGHNYLKDTVSEVFSIEGTTAKWESTSEKGSAEFDGEAIFSAINSSFGPTDLWLRKALQSKTKEVKLLPSGSIKIASIETHKIDTLDLRLIEYTGQSFTPGYVWVDKEDRFFAYTSSWLSCIQKGYDSLVKKMLPIQQAREASYFKNLATELIEDPTEKILIKNANLFNSNDGSVQPNQNILIDGNRIIKVTSEAISEKGVQVIDATAKTLMPGLFDMHTHIGETDGLLNLAAGVTSVRDLANSFDLIELADNFNNNTLIGPRIVVMSGFIDQAGPYAGPTGAIVTSLEEGLAAIDDYHSKGYKQIKLYSSIDPSWVKPMADRTHALGMRLSGHIPSFMIAEQAIEAGYDEIQHANMIALNFLSDTIDTRTPLRFSMVAKHNHLLDFNSEKWKDFIALLKRENIVIDPTVSIFEGMMVTKAGEPDPSFEMILDRLPLSVQRGFYSGGQPIEEGMEETHKASYQKLLGIVKELYDNGITIVPGTDSMAGFGYHVELENYVKAGIPASEVLKIATSVSAKVCGVQNSLGSIEEGKLADLILVDGDPTQNISDIRKIALTIKDGKIYDPQKLYNAIGVRHYK